MSFESLSEALRCLTTFRGLLELKEMQALQGLLSALEREPGALRERYAQFLYSVREAGYSSLSRDLWEHLRYDETAFGRAVAWGREDPAFCEAARQDLAVLSQAASLSFHDLKIQIAARLPEQRSAILALPELEQGQTLAFDRLLEGYRRDGVGVFAKGRAFLWEHGSLRSVRNPDPITREQMLLYSWQREAVLENTRHLVQGAPAANVLLYGDSGTGKSATIKSLVNEPEFGSLRVVEVGKNSLSSLTELVRLVSEQPQKFILYLDDLSFETSDRGYSALKTALEGGLENLPGNAVIYATSNRRHLVRETFEDRQGSDIHRDETIQERTSLSERFGLRILYMSLSKPEYLQMVRAMAVQAGLELAAEELERRANQWEIQHGGRTPRVARQFVDSLVAEKSL